MSTAYNCECRFKVEWEDLAPSLQARFRNIENDLINVHNSINTINKNIQNIENNIDVIEGNIIQNENKINNLTNINNTTLQNLNNVLTNINNLNKNYQNINNTVSNMNNTVNNINQNYQNINNQVTNIQKVQEEAVDGLNGQVLKVNAKSKKMYAHDEIIFVDCVTNQLELEKAMTKKPISMQEIFNNWYRYAHFCAAAASQLDNTNNSGIPDGQNRTDNTQFTAYTDPTKGGWTFDQATDTIHNNFDYNVSAGFINPEDKYSSFYLKVRADTGWDDDHINIIVGYMRDSSGVEHTLTLARGAGLLNGQTTLDTKFLWGLIYDANNPTQFFINDLSSKTTPRSANGGSHNICYMTAIRSNTLMEFRTTDWDPNGNAKTDIKGLTFQFKYPDSKPSNWTQAMYDNIGVMMKNPNRIGFGARSTTGWFRIEEQDGIMTDQDIYDFQNDVIYHYDFFNNRWVKRTASDSNFTKPSEKFSDRTFIYNERTQKLYYYYYKGRIIPLDTNISNINNQINNINESITNLNNSINKNNEDIKFNSNNIEFISNNLQNRVEITEIGDGLKFENGILSNNSSSNNNVDSPEGSISGSLYIDIQTVNVKHNDGTTITFRKPFKHKPSIFIYGEDYGTHALVNPLRSGWGQDTTINPGLTNTYVRIRIPVWCANLNGKSDLNYKHDVNENFTCVAIGVV